MLKKVSTPNDPMPHEPRLYRVVAQRIQDLIREERIAPGERLPSERELATRLNLSRASLREGLIALELGGVVEVRSGSGVYVSVPLDAAHGIEEGGPGPFEVLSARRMVEAEVCAVARSAMRAHLERVTRTFSRG